MMDFNDPYFEVVNDNISDRYHYVLENIPISDTEYIFTEGCDCKDICRADCACILKYGSNYIRKDNNTTNLHDNLCLHPTKNNSGLYECNMMCKCKHKNCGNRLVQFGPRKDLDVRNCGAKGSGLFTTRKIQKGNFICEYAGEIISEIEAVQRFDRNKNNNKMNYIICVREHFGDRLNTCYIDPSHYGNIGRFLNHSCNPNCGLVPVRVDNPNLKLCVFAKVDIGDNTELTFDYGDGLGNEGSSENLKKCFCGEEVCRNWMPFSPSFTQS